MQHITKHSAQNYTNTIHSLKNPFLIMTHEYWLNRWERNEIGFHQEGFNPYLMEYWTLLNIPDSGKVFLPLCGKSRDMIWLHNRGHAIFGVELSKLAVADFFQENKFNPIRQAERDFTRYAAGRITILQGDFFNLNKKHLEKVSAVYDRASLVALPPDTRQRYVRHMMHLLPPATQILLVGFDYPQSEMQGPPYAVSSQEISMLYQHHAEINLLKQVDVLDENPRFQQLGLSRLEENIVLLTTKS